MKKYIVTVLFFILSITLFANVAFASPIFVSKFGTNGVGPGQLNSATGIVGDSLGNIYVAEAGNQRISKFDSAGNFLFSFSSFGVANGQIDYPVGMAVDGSDNLYVAEMLNHRISKFDSAGNFLMKIGVGGSGNGQFNRPRDVFVDASSKVYVADGTNRRVQIFDSTGTYLSKFGVGGTAPGQLGSFAMGIELDSAGNIYVASWGSGANYISKFSNTGTYISRFTVSNTGCPTPLYIPFQMTITPANDLYVSATGCNRIDKYTTAGVFQYSIGGNAVGTADGMFNGTSGLFVIPGANDKIYVADTGNHRVQVFQDVPPTITGPTLITTYNAQTPITGTCISGSTVTVSVDGSIIAPTGSCSAGTFSIVPTSGLSLGAHTLSAVQGNLPSTNPIGLKSSLSTITGSVTILQAPTKPDMTNGTDSGTSNTDNVTSITTPTFTGACNTGETVTLYNDGIAMTPTQVCSGSSYSITVTSPLHGGDNAITATFTNISASPTESAQSPKLMIYLDSLPPSDFSATMNPTSPFSFTNPEFTFATTDDTGTVTYTVSEDGGPFIATTSPYVPSTPINPSLPHHYIFRATDQFGNTTDAHLYFYPAVVISAPTVISNTAILDTTIKIIEPAASAAYLSTVDATIDGLPVVLSCSPVVPGAGTEKITDCTIVGGIPGTVGSHTLVVNATNNSAGVGQSTQVYTIDTTQPVLSISAPTLLSNNSILDTTVTISDAHGVKDVLLTGGTLNTCTPTVPTDDRNRTVVCTVTISATGTLGVTVHDLAGNSRVLSQPGYIIDPIVPIIGPLSISSGSTFGVLKTMTFSVTDNQAIIPSGISLMPGATGVGALTCVAFSSTQVDCSLPITGNALFTIQASDTFSNNVIGLPTTYTLLAPLVDMKNSTDTGILNSDGVTNITNPTFVGSCSNGETVTLFIDSVSVLPTVVCSGGAYEITPTNPLLDGSYDVTVQFSQGAQTSLMSSILQIRIDTAAPVVSITSPTTSSMYTSPIVVSGTCSTADGVVTVNGTTTSCTLGTFSVSIVSQTGVYTASQTDTAGNTTTSSVTVQLPSAPVILSVANSSSTLNPTSVSNSSQNNTNETSFCLPYILKDIRLGSQNDSVEVNKLITFLNTYEGQTLNLDGTYDQDDFLAVKVFQTKYFSEIIAPWGGKTATGIVSNFTRGKINVMYCAKTKSLACPYFSTYHKQGDSSTEVIKIKNFLNLLMNANLVENNSYDKKTFESVKSYQELYSDTVLKPWGLKSGTGRWYQSTRFSSNRIVGCDEGQRTLDNGTIVK